MDEPKKTLYHPKKRDPMEFMQLPIFMGILYLTGLSGPYRYVTMDSVTSMIDFLSMTLLDKPLALYQKTPLSDRYLYYTLLYGLELLGNLFFAGMDPFPFLLFWGCSILAVPCVSLWMMDLIIHGYHVFDRVKKRVYTYCHKQTKRLLSLIFASILNLICETTLDMNPAITRKEIATTFSESDYASVSLFIRIFVFTNIVATFESKGMRGKGMTAFLKTMYNAGQVLEVKSQYQDPFPNIPDPADKIRAVLLSRRLEQFFNPYVLMMLLQLYETKRSSKITEILSQKVRYFEYLTTKFCSVYTAGTVTKSPIIMFGLSNVLLFYRDVKTRSYWGIALDVCLRSFGLLSTYLTGSYLLGSIICEYSELLYNRATIFTLRALGKKLEKYYRLFVANREYLPDIVIPIGVLTCLYRFELEPYIFLLFVALGFSIARNRYIFGVIATSGFFSSYGVMHLLGVGVTLYSGISLRDVDIFPEEYLDPKMVTSYLMTPPVMMHEEPMIVSMYEQNENREEEITASMELTATKEGQESLADAQEQCLSCRAEEPSSFPAFIPSGRRVSPSGRRFPSISAPSSLSSSPIILGDIHEDYRRTPSYQHLYMSVDSLEQRRPLIIQSDNEEEETPKEWGSHPLSDGVIIAEMYLED